MKKLLLLSLNLFVCMLAMGEPVSSKQALEIASGYLLKSGAPRRAAAQMSVQPFMTDRQGNPLMYAVNNGGDGYVIVSGDDRMRQVLGYSNSGSLDLADMPSNMRYWLQSLSADIQLLIDAGYQPQPASSRRAASAVKSEVKIMLTSQWGQTTPYNDLCPKEGETTTLTGCVATAMAQVIYYHKKERQAEIPSKPLQDTEAYTGDRGIDVPALKASDYTIDWSQLMDDYNATGAMPTATQKLNVARLMYFCGATVEMDYNSQVSLAYDMNVAPALIKYFGFSPATRIVSRSSYTEQQWADLMYNELKSGRPVLYGGSGTGGGHQFVIDGYDGNEMFHINWGWGGNSDNYFALSVLNYEESFPIGARESTAAFASGQSAIINAEYGGTAQAADRLSFLGSEIEDSYKLHFALINYTGVDNSFEACLAMKDLQTDKITYSEVVTWNLKKRNYNIYQYDFNSPHPASANKNLMIYPVSRVKGTTEWLTVSDPVLEYAKASYDAEGNLTLTLHPTGKLSTTIEVEGNKYTGIPQKVKAVVNNTGDEQQMNIYFWIKQDADYFTKTAVEDLKYDAYAGITALKDATHVEVASYTPASAGTYYIWVTRDGKGKQVLAKSQVDIVANPHTVNGLAFAEFNPTGLQTTTIQPNGDIVLDVYAPSIVAATFKLVNASSTAIANATVSFKIYKKEGESWNQKGSWSLQNPISLEHGEGGGVRGWTFAEGVGQYRLDLLCDNVVTDTRYINTYETYSVAGNDGKLTTNVYTTGTITTPEGATAMLLNNIVSNTIAVTPNDNPNTLYYLGSGKTATGLDGKNVVNVDQATSITLQDGKDFYVAKEFTAQSITYKRSFEAGWTTLMVPFETTIPEGLTALEFVSEDGSEVSFKQVSKLLAFEPYLVRVDAAKEVTFTGSNQKLFSNYTDAATALNFKFIGTTSKPAYNLAYFLNADGTKFVKTTSPSYQSFRGCFVPTYGATNLPDVLTVKDATTGIKTVQATDAKTDDGYYNLAGQRVSADYKGIVIHNGKKVVKK